MNLDDLPVVSQVFESGADDRVFDSLLLLGPVVIVLIVLLGRSLLTAVLAVFYLGVFCGYVVYRGATFGS
ncbi:hypothetical protein L593_05395 [Salinarchaeum sp. Harcht-Bsk1]|uniref:hypothetical protein n=1 Tax=Salinarchaeum sp. Harcht-Bsk1 TaxID=1333523 RepID=UPI00034244AE|nr:hypothetical protein [Salinarchaeum sp. Harcht-Bsk1]AGN01028.1 hypothetical protein L593_05395 [Salinarchaeum sp. Harcht-Bsk1]